LPSEKQNGNADLVLILLLYLAQWRMYPPQQCRPRLVRQDWTSRVLAEVYEVQIAPLFLSADSKGTLGWLYCCLRSCVGGLNTFRYLEGIFLWDLK